MISVWDALALSAVVALAAFVSSRLKLGLERTLVVSSLRAVAQLGLIAWVLSLVFRSQSVWVAFPLLGVMTIIASQTAIARVRTVHRGLSKISLIALAASNWTMVAYGTVFLLRANPPFSPAAVIPFAGILLGNSLSGISLGLDQWLFRLQSQSDRIELLLSHGATRFEAIEDILRESLRSGLLPVLNSMTVAGVVSLPGMMVGQMLAGSDPSTASRLQIIILLLMASGTLFGTLLSILLSFRIVFNRRHQFLHGELRSAAAAARAASLEKRPWIQEKLPFWKLKKLLAPRF